MAGRFHTSNPQPGDQIIFNSYAYTGIVEMIVGTVVLGIFTAHAAMNGFDKYKELFDRLKTFKGQ